MKLMFCRLNEVKNDFKIIIIINGWICLLNSDIIKESIENDCKIFLLLKYKGYYGFKFNKDCLNKKYFYYNNLDIGSDIENINNNDIFVIVDCIPVVMQSGGVADISYNNQFSDTETVYDREFHNNFLKINSEADYNLLRFVVDKESTVKKWINVYNVSEDIIFNILDSGLLS